MLKIEKYQKGYECMKNGENTHQRHTFSHEHSLKITQSKQLSNTCINHQQEKEKSKKLQEKRKQKHQLSKQGKSALRQKQASKIIQINLKH